MAHSNQPTILWHDYETWGVNPQKDHPSQFAGIRTDLDLNVIGEPLNWYCQIPNDYLPHPGAALVTGITPQKTLRDGYPEFQFIDKIITQFIQPQTCGAGYNSVRFDDEVTRYTAYRNFFDPYAREWQNGNSRWDLIDLVRACYALRPEGIEWVYKDDASPSFRLEELSAANGISHSNAHDALSDVFATIELAKLIKTKQPKLFDFAFNLRSKHEVNKQIDCFNMVPLVHVSSKFPAINGCCSWIVPICPHPDNSNGTIVINLALDPTPLFELSEEQIREKLYTPTKDLDEGEQRIPLKVVHSNRCPFIAPAKTLTEENAERLGIDRAACLQNLKKIQNFAGIQQKCSAIFQEQKEERTDVDADHALYFGGFISNADRTKSELLRTSTPEQLENFNEQFEDPRLNSLLFRYRARYFPYTLSAEELLKWQRHREYRLRDENSPSSMTIANYYYELEQLAEKNSNNPKAMGIIKSLYQYAEQL